MRATLPRIRYDQLMRFGWQVLLPLAVANALFTAVVVAFGWPWWASGLFGLAVIVLGTAIYYARQRAKRSGGKLVTPAGGAMPDSVRLVRVGPLPAAPEVQVAPDGRGDETGVRAGASNP